MIPYEELDRALARWKARAHNAAPEATREMVMDDDGSAVVVGEMEARGSVPQPGANGLPPPPIQTGELDLEEEVVETYDDDDGGGSNGR